MWAILRLAPPLPFLPAEVHGKGIVRSPCSTWVTQSRVRRSSSRDETDRVRSAYGPNYDRLAQVKRKYDPNNLFRMNQNIAPA